MYMYPYLGDMYLHYTLISLDISIVWGILNIHDKSGLLYSHPYGHLCSLLQPFPVSLMPWNVHCIHIHHLYVMYNYKSKKLDFFTNQMMTLKMLLILQIHLMCIVSSVYSRCDEITCFTPAWTHLMLHLEKVTHFIKHCGISSHHSINTGSQWWIVSA